MIGSLGLPEVVMIALTAAIWVLGVGFPATKICSRLGFSPYLGLLAIVPVANIGLLFFVAFSKWPVSAAKHDAGEP
jgi:predicted membrane protein